jgi:molybdopterin-guanine dinucleotide biosynthesis protein A
MTHVQRKRVVGVLLAGGKSERMGTDKALLDFAGAPMSAWCAAALASCAPTILVSSATERHARTVARVVSSAWPAFTVLRGVAFEPVADAAPDKGPLSGLVSAFERSGAEYAVMSACDTPLVPAEFYRRAVALLEDAPAVAPTLERAEPLISAWRRAEALAAARPLLAEGRGPHRLVEALRARLVPREEITAWGLDPRHFASANTPEALAALLALARPGPPSA